MTAVELLHWGALGVALVISWWMFRDLADISQWLVTVKREKVFSTFRKRHRLAAIWAAASLTALATLALASAGNAWVFGALSLVAFFGLFMGYINPPLMMRSQFRSARYYSIQEARTHLASDTSLIVMDANGCARGHPDKHILRPHVAGEEGGLCGTNVVMTYCGLTNLGIAYKPVIDGEAVELAPMTQLENNFVMWDRTTGEPSQQFWGRRIGDGPMGAAMEEWPSYRMPLWAFEKAFPEGKVFLNPLPTFSENPLAAIYDRIVQLMFLMGIKEQKEKRLPTFPTIPEFDERLDNKAKIYGIIIEDDVVAYTEHFIRAQGDRVNTVIGGSRVVVAYHSEFDSVGVYLNPHPQPVSSIAFDGDSDLGKLARVPKMRAGAYWVIWQHFYPETEVNRPPLERSETDPWLAVVEGGAS